MRCLVTGGTGFVGSNLVEALVKQGHDVQITGFDSEQPLPLGVKILYPSLIGIDWDALGKIDVLFHQAAINNTVLLDEREMLRANVEASKKLFEEVVKRGCKRIVYASSTAVYGNAPAPYVEGKTKLQPLNPYAVSKQKLEESALQFAKQHNDVVLVGLRYCNVYGPGESHKGKRASMIYQLAGQMVKGDPRIFKHGEQKRDYIYVADVVTANLLAAKTKNCCIVNCGSGKATTFNDVIKILNTTMKLQRKPVYFDNPYVGRYQDHTECDMNLAKEKIGFVPQFTLEKGIQAFYQSGKLTS
ncbi:NAD-dependent epimerase/dehydratase family protein [Candidatus Woesearchaeota archaeon]|nr:NAD-dependent epimerase/dehydratase family protein [Candidatus Woesearchaeota archaeon]